MSPHALPLTSHSAATDHRVKRLRRRLLRELSARAPVVPPSAYFAPKLLSPTALRVDPEALMRPRRGQTSGGGTKKRSAAKAKSTGPSQPADAPLTN